MKLIRRKCRPKHSDVFSLFFFIKSNQKRYSSETYASIFKVAYGYKKAVGTFPLPAHLSHMTCVSFKVAQKALLYISGENDVLHRPSGHGYSGFGSMKLSMTDQYFLLGLYQKDPSRPLYSYVTKLYKFSGTKVQWVSMCGRKMPLWF